MSIPKIDLSEFPDLARPFRWKWGPLDGRFELLGRMPEDHLVSNVRIVPFLAGYAEQMVVLKMENGNWDHPGGTREPGEPFLETARRELLEEAGARLISLHPFGLFRCHSYRETPYRTHLPHPDFFHVVAAAEVELVGEPENPPDEGEFVLEVHSVSLEEAVARFVTRDDGGMWMADMYRLGALVREMGRPDWRSSQA